MIHEIISGIYISNMNTSLDNIIYKKYNITIVLNISTTIPFVNLNIKKIRLPFNNIQILKNNFNNILLFIYKHFIEYNILICCDENYHLLIIALFLIKYGNIQHYNIKHILQSKHESLCLDYDLSVFI